MKGLVRAMQGGKPRPPGAFGDPPRPELLATVPNTGRVWAVSAIHGEADRLNELHRRLWPLFRPGDPIVYLGNVIGHGPDVRATVDNLLLFRRALMARPGVEPEHLVYLRGAQEESLTKLLQLHYAPDPRAVLDWLESQGIEATLAAYGTRLSDGRAAAQSGNVALARWTGALREAMARNDGHRQLIAHLKHAARTEDGKLLFVSAGLDPDRPLSAQGDRFWWDGQGFAAIKTPYQGHRTVVRGFDRRQRGIRVAPHAATLDAGAGFGGPITAALFNATGAIIEMIEG